MNDAGWCSAALAAASSCSRSTSRATGQRAVQPGPAPRSAARHPGAVPVASRSVLLPLRFIRLVLSRGEQHAPRSRGPLRVAARPLCRQKPAYPFSKEEAQPSSKATTAGAPPGPVVCYSLRVETTYAEDWAVFGGPYLLAARPRAHRATCLAMPPPATAPCAVVAGPPAAGQAPDSAMVGIGRAATLAPRQQWIVAGLW